MSISRYVAREEVAIAAKEDVKDAAIDGPAPRSKRTGHVHAVPLGKMYSLLGECLLTGFFDEVNLFSSLIGHVCVGDTDE
ncbi:MAG: hypothetical protein LUD00_08135 [Prevotellaceae bacterium]|nr:hypothetical protein [Prevotellaceae bacterium]